MVSIVVVVVFVLYAFFNTICIYLDLNDCFLLNFMFYFSLETNKQVCLSYPLIPT